ncbi:MAG: NYN domain-containing protein [Erysipelotrichaceae bacterium]|nr:NYN domain-containing protein [Erysipelotrichaceae bacterium]
MKQITLGLVAHVDAGKTTCSEAILYTCGTIRSSGRVDHKDTFLDYDSQERSRGITIYLKQARFDYKETHFTLLDTPGHLDFSCEMERTLQVLDVAVLILSSNEPVQSHTRTIWKLLNDYHIPTFLFVNKMDISYATKEEILQSLQKELSSSCIPLDTIDEEVALLDDELLEQWTENNTLSAESLQKAIAARHIFPVYFGSGLKQDGITELLEGLNQYAPQPHYPADFGARVFKITRDPQGNRLTHIKMTGGSLKVKNYIENEKVDQIRLYHGNQFTMKDEVFAGEICSLKGPHNLQIGQGIGYEHKQAPLLQSCLSYEMVLPKEVDPFLFMQSLQQLKEEDPQLDFRYNTEQKSIHARLMGEVQIEILRQVILDRFKTDVSFKEGRVTYKETILNTTEGVGHFEPLRHYAEAHLLLEPLPTGSGIQIVSDCPVDFLKLQWQNQILSALDEAELTGVLTNSELTDIKITLISGKGHIKHTEGQDFNEAAMRALRHGLLKNESVLLEPYGTYTLRIPTTQLSKAYFDMEQRQATIEVTDTNEQFTTVTGKGPIRLLQNYQMQVLSYTQGKGSFQIQFASYEPSLDQRQLIEETGYNPLEDVSHPCGSVFCHHGAGVVVPFEEVEEYMHLPLRQTVIYEPSTPRYNTNKVSDEEMNRIMNKLYPKKELPKEQIRKKVEEPKYEKPKPSKPKCLIVDGYNMIFCWENLKQMATTQIANARDLLIEILDEYAAHYKGKMILVFDAYLQDGKGSSQKRNNLEIVYTKKGQTADSYIEKAIGDLLKDYTVTVATSDNLEQVSAHAQGALRCSARELELMIQAAHTKTKDLKYTQAKGHYPLQGLKDKVKDSAE